MQPPVYVRDTSVLSGWCDALFDSYAAGFNVKELTVSTPRPWSTGAAEDQPAHSPPTPSEEPEITEESGQRLLVHRDNMAHVRSHVLKLIHDNKACQVRLMGREENVHLLKYTPDLLVLYLSSSISTTF